MKSILGLATCLCCLGAGLPAAGMGESRPAVAETPVVTVSTTLLGAAVSAIAGDRVAVNLLMPPDTCPGHFALSPRQAADTAASALFLMHGFEPFMRAAGERFDAVGHTLEAQGNAMLPAGHLAMSAEVRDVLAERLPAQRAVLATRFERYAAAIRDAETTLRPELAALDGMPVLAAVQNRELVEWMGAKVVAVFPRDEALTPRGYQDLLDRARAGGVALVIDNRQSSGRLGRRLAEALDVPLAVTSNFPASIAADAYPAALRAACHAVLAAMPGRESVQSGAKAHAADH